MFSSKLEAQDFQYFYWNKLTTDSNSLKYKLPGSIFQYRPALKGSEFINDNWSKGTVILVNGDHYENLDLKYNSLLEELVMYNEEVGAIIMLDKPAIAEFTLVDKNEKISKFRKILVEKISKKDIFLQVLYEGKLKLYLHYKTNELATSIYYDRSGTLQSSELRLTKTYFLNLPEKGFIRFSPNKRFFADLFPDQKKTIKKLHRENHLKYKNTDDIIKAVRIIEKSIIN